MCGQARKPAYTVDNAALPRERPLRICPPLCVVRPGWWPLSLAMGSCQAGVRTLPRRGASYPTPSLGGVAALPSFLLVLWSPTGGGRGTEQEGAGDPPKGLWGPHRPQNLILGKLVSVCLLGIKQTCSEEYVCWCD